MAVFYDKLPVTTSSDDFSREFLLRAFVLLICLFSFPLGWAAESTPPALEEVGIDPPLGTQLPLAEEFVDEAGKSVPLSTYFTGTRPVIVLLNYYSCPMLCGMLLNAARDSLQKIHNWLPGDHYEVVVISIDPKEDSDLAAAKKHSLLGSLEREDYKKAAVDHWHFLVGKKGSEARLAQALGFRFKWIPEEKQYAHGAALFLASPTGKLSRVLTGIDFPPRDLKFALLETSEGKVGSLAEKLVLFCYHYDPKDNKYALLASRLVSLGGAVTVVAMLLAYGLWFRSNRRKGKSCSLSR